MVYSCFYFTFRRVFTFSTIIIQLQLRRCVCLVAVTKLVNKHQRVIISFRNYGTASKVWTNDWRVLDKTLITRGLKCWRAKVPFTHTLDKRGVFSYWTCELVAGWKCQHVTTSRERSDPGHNEAPQPFKVSIQLQGNKESNTLKLSYKRLIKSNPWWDKHQLPCAIHRRCSLMFHLSATVQFDFTAAADSLCQANVSVSEKRNTRRVGGAWTWETSCLCRNTEASRRWLRARRHVKERSRCQLHPLV